MNCNNKPHSISSDYIRIICIIVFLLNATVLFAQKKNRTIIADGSFLFLPIQKGMYGLSICPETVVLKKILVGLNVAFAEGNSSSSFGYNTTKPLLSFTSFGLVTEYKIIDKEKLQFNFALSNNLTYMDLSDGNNTTYSAFHFNRFASNYSHALLAENIQYTIQPGVVMAFSILKFKYICAKVNYNILVGGTKFGNINDFQTFSFSLGVRLP